MEVVRAGPDILRRFTPTPLSGDLSAMGHTIRLETNSAAILRKTAKALEKYRPPDRCGDDFLWRLVVEEGGGAQEYWQEGISSDGVTCLSIGKSSFFIVDGPSRIAVGFVSEDLLDAGRAFETCFLPGLFTATAESLGLVAFSAACIAWDGKGLLLLGPARSGKTLCCLVASRRGWEYHSDQIVFLETAGSDVRVWGDFWPATLDPEARKILPELATSAQTVPYGDSTQLWLDRMKLPAPRDGGLRPVAGAILASSAPGIASVRRLGPSEWEQAIRENRLHKDADRNPGFDQVARRLGNLPAYRVATGGDPVAAVEICQSIVEKAP